MAELYIFNRDNELLTILTESNGLLEAPVHDLLNTVSDTPFQFTVDANKQYEHVYKDRQHTSLTQVASMFIGTDKEGLERINVSPAQFVTERNRVVFRDRQGDFREFVIDELDDSDDINGPETTAICIPAWQYELQKKYVLDKRYSDKEAQDALDDSLAGTRYIGDVQVDLGRASTNFYRIRSVDAIWKILKVWGGDFKDTVDLNSKGRISQRNILIKQRRGGDKGLRFEIDHNMESVERTLISDPITAVYGWGASLDTEDEEGNKTGGHTRYIDFGDVEWKKSEGDPVDKPKGQMWVGDPDALKEYGIPHDGGMLHLYSEMSNQDYEEKEELLRATWEHLQANKGPKVNYKLNADLFDKNADLGDTAQALDRLFARPIEIQTRIIGVKYDLLDIDNTYDLEMGQFLNLNDPYDDIRDDLDKIKDKVNAPEPPRDPEDDYPDTIPDKPTNFKAVEGYRTIQLSWDYDDAVYVKRYELYASQSKDFVPDKQHLVWQGDSNMASHEAETDQTWYFYVRAVNYHGRASGFSDRVKASTLRVIDDDSLFGPDMADRLRDLNRISDIIGDGGVDLENLHEEIPDHMKQKAKEYTDEEINDMVSDLEGVFEGRGDRFKSITQYIDEVEGAIGAKVERGVFDEFTESYEYDMAQMNIKYDEISSTVSNIRVGGRNLLRYTDFSLDDNVDKWTAFGNSKDTATYKVGSYTFLRTNSTDGIQEGESYTVRTPYHLQLNEDGAYTISWLGTSSTHAEFNRAGLMKGGYYFETFSPSNITREEVITTDIFGYRKTIYRYSGTIDSLSDPEDEELYFFVRYINKNDSNSWFFVSEPQIENGTMVTDYSPNPADLDQEMRIAQSEIKQLAEKIVLKVDVDSVVSEINLSKEGIRIAGDLIHLDGTSLIEDAVIKAAHIANAVIDRSHLKDAIIDTAQIEDAAIKNAKIADAAIDNAKIANLSASKIRTGVLKSIVIESVTIRTSDFETLNGDVMHFNRRGNNFGGRIDTSGDEHFRFQSDKYTYLLVSDGGANGGTGSRRRQLINFMAKGTNLFRFGLSDDTDYDHAVMMGGKEMIKFLDSEETVQIRNVGDTRYVDFHARDITATGEFIDRSSEIYKSNIKRFNKNALEIVNESVIYEYDKEDTRQIGLIVERETPKEIIRGDGISGYTMRSILWKSVQELYESTDNRLTDLEVENKMLKERVRQLEGAA